MITEEEAHRIDDYIRQATEKHRKDMRKLLIDLWPNEDERRDVARTICKDESLAENV